MSLAESIQNLSQRVDGLTRLLNHSLDENGGVELALNVLPNVSNQHYVYQLARAGRIPCRKIGGRYQFSRLELTAWIADGSPQPATSWAAEYRRLSTLQPTTDAA